MKYSLSNCRPLALVAVFVACSLVTMSETRAGVVFNQITDPFEAYAPPFSGGVPSAASVYDTGADGVNFPFESATAFDNFSFAQSNLIVTSFSWVGFYDDDDADFADNFVVRVFGNDTSGGFPNQPATTPLQQFDVGKASETKIIGDGIDGEVGLLDGFYRYTANVTPFAIDPNETYWFSVVATLNLDNNDWGVAYSDFGSADDVLFHDVNDSGLTLTRYLDPSDLAFSVTASVVPEPSSFLAFAAIGMAGGLHRRRRVRSRNS